MTFFDSKEEVLDVQLTRYGRHMLSKGMMRPTFYAFFDDNVTYDSRYERYILTHLSSLLTIQKLAPTPALMTAKVFRANQEILSNLEYKKRLHTFTPSILSLVEKSIFLIMWKMT